MDTRRIIQKDGYRYEDLSQQNQNVIDWCRWLQADISDHLDVTYQADDGDTIIEKIIKEIAGGMIEDLKEYIDITIAEYQIALIESQEEDEESE